MIISYIQDNWNNDEFRDTILAMDGIAMRQKKHTTRPFLLLGIIIFLLGIGITVFLRILKKDALISPVGDGQVGFSFFGKKEVKDPEKLTEKIKSVVDSQWSNYSVLVDDLDSEFLAEISPKVTFPAASVNKIPILASVYYLAEKGTVDLDKVITVQTADIQDYGTGSIRYDAPGSTYSVQTLARLMMQISDNTAAYILANHIVGMDTLTELVHTWGLYQTDMIANDTSNADIAKLLIMIYRGEIADFAHTKEMLSFMTDTDNENRLPEKLPKNLIIYHKGGTAVGALHDVGIVDTGTKKYYIGIFTRDITDEPSTESLMADVSKTVYEFMR